MNGSIKLSMVRLHVVHAVNAKQIILKKSLSLRAVKFT